MEKYEKSQRRAPLEQPPPAANEVRVIGSGRLRAYVDQTVELLQTESPIIIKAMGRAINKVVALVEVVKRRVPGLHQVTEISTIPITDLWEPKEEGTDLSPISVTRNVSAINVLLATSGLDVRHPGYQPPLSANEVVPVGEEELEEMERGDIASGRGRGRGGRGRGRGGRGGRGRGGQPGGPGGEFAATDAAFQEMAINEQGGAGGEGGDSGRGRGRGRGGRRGGRRSGRGQGRGGEGGGEGQGGGEGGGQPCAEY